MHKETLSDILPTNVHSLENRQEVLNILLMEDTISIANTVIEMLESFGHSVTWHSGTVKLPYTFKEFDAILCDRDNSNGKDTLEFHTDFLNAFQVFAEGIEQKDFSSAKTAILKAYPFSAERLNNEYLRNRIVSVLGELGFFASMEIEDIRREMPQLSQDLVRRTIRKDGNLISDLTRLFA